MPEHGEHLKQIEIEKEFHILSVYAQVSNLPESGLNDVQNMLDLFQFSAHIKNIGQVCEQYQLTACMNDPSLKELRDIIEFESSKPARDNRANMRIQRIKKILFDESEPNSKCFEVFSAIQDCSAFYQFVKDKKFDGSQGQALFRQQHQLITAQLQHEEYEEHVLNHLVVAFRAISPFMDPQKKFRQLMRDVIALNTGSILKQLKTVNDNISLIQLWFSRAEVRIATWPWHDFLYLYPLISRETL